MSGPWANSHADLAMCKSQNHRTATNRTKGSRRNKLGIESGVSVIEAALKTMSSGPGVYRMLDAKTDALYVGKARDLKHRVISYVQVERLPERLRRMVSETVAVEVVITHTEAEALLLEANLIKQLKPRYNIVLRDDKSYPWLMLAEDHPYPRISKHRGAHSRTAAYWGPFASAWAVNQTVTAMQRVFLLRSCSDTVFATRKRPCLLFQIKRCSAPCVGRVEPDTYRKLVRQAKTFLAGGAGDVQQELAADMEAAAASLEFERAAAVRDRLRGLTFVQGDSAVNPISLSNADVIVACQLAGQTCVQVFFIRGGRNNGNRAFFPLHTSSEEPSKVLTAFIGQFYDDKPAPPILLVNHQLQEVELIAEALSLKVAHKVQIHCPQRGERLSVVRHAETNAREALEQKLAESATQMKLLNSLQDLFALPTSPKRIEVYDNSHTMGTSPFGVMIVAGVAGFEKAAYRKFSVRGPVTPGDDLAMMREVLHRRFARALKEQASGAPMDWPDLLLIDGGPSQLTAASSVMADLGIGEMKVVAIAKGPDRNAGREWIHAEGSAPFQLPPRDPVLYLLQRLRDEAHRFAIAAHRAGRSTAIRQSELDEIEGVGSSRKRALLNHFGSTRGVKMAGLTDLEAAPGISRETARRIYAHFHPGLRMDHAL